MRRLTMLGAAPLALLLSSAAFADTPSWKVTEVSGPVSLRHANMVRPAARGAALNPGDIVTTGAGARAVLVRGEEYVIVSPATQLRLPEAEKTSGIMQMIEDFGTAIYKIQKKVTPHFGVQTPYLAAVVKGTTFTVTVGPHGGSVQVIEGKVEVATNDGGARQLVEPGVVAQVGASNLYRLTIDGDTKRVIDSPRSPVAGAGGGSAAAKLYNGPDAKPVHVAEVSEGKKPLDEITHGMVQGDASTRVAMSVAAAARADRQAAKDKPDDGGAKADDKGKPAKTDPAKNDPEKDHSPSAPASPGATPTPPPTPEASDSDDKGDDTNADEQKDLGGKGGKNHDDKDKGLGKDKGSGQDKAPKR